MFPRAPGYYGRNGILGPGNTVQRGNGGRIVLGGTATNGVLSGPVLQISGENSPEPESVLLTLYRSNIDSPELIHNNAAPRARIRWGTGKVMNQALLDYQHGLQLSLCASSVEVHAELASMNGAAIVSQQMELAASLVSGATSSRQAVLTEPSLSLNAGGTSSFYTVPDFAVWWTWIGVSDVNVQFSSDKATILSGLVPAGTGVEYAIPGGTEYVRVINPGAAGTFGQIVWTLSI